MSDDRMHDRLTGAGERWRAGQPERPVPLPALRSRSSRLVVPAAAALVVAAAGGGWAVAQLAQEAPGPGGPATSTSPEPTTTPPSATTSPDRPQGPRECTADDLAATQTTEGAMGTTYLTVMLDATGAPCRLQGYPDVTLLAGGQPLDVPVQHHPQPITRVTVGGQGFAALEIGWSPTHSCADVDNDTIRVTLPDGSSLEVPGFGPTSCSPGEADFQPLTLRPFTQGRS